MRAIANTPRRTQQDTAQGIEHQQCSLPDAVMDVVFDDDLYTEKEMIEGGPQ